MRILGGSLKGARFIGPKNRAVRPTSSRVLKSVFDIIADQVPESTILDLFAGSGSFGFEAISRGAAHVVFVDKNRSVTAALLKSASLLGIERRVSILNTDAAAALKRLQAESRKFSIIFLDPPYSSDLISETFFAPSLPKRLTCDGILIIEKRSDDHKLIISTIFGEISVRKYGDSEIRIYALAEQIY